MRSLEENATLKKKAASAQLAESRLSKRLQDDAEGLLQHAKLIRETVLDNLRSLSES